MKDEPNYDIFEYSKILYGSTELSPVITLHNINDPLSLKMTTVGKVVGHTEVRTIFSLPEIENKLPVKN